MLRSAASRASGAAPVGRAQPAVFERDGLIVVGSQPASHGPVGFARPAPEEIPRSEPARWPAAGNSALTTPQTASNTSGLNAPTMTGMVAPAGHGRLDFALSAARLWIRGLDEYPLLCETLQLSDRGPVGFARPEPRGDPES